MLLTFNAVVALNNLPAMTVGQNRTCISLLDVLLIMTITWKICEFIFWLADFINEIKEADTIY